MTPVFTDSGLDNAWPFWVLGLDIHASNSDIEKAAQTLSAKLKLGAPGAALFDTPVGQRKRDEFLVREAKAALQNPDTRLLAEFWYLSPNEKPSTGNTATDNKNNNQAHQQSQDTLYWLKALGVHT